MKVQIYNSTNNEVTGKLYRLITASNRVIIFLIALITLAILGSCSEDFVVRYPTTSTVVENFYKTPENASTGLNAAYSMLLRDDWWSSFVISQIASDECAGGGGTGDGGGYERYDRGLQQPEIGANQTLWLTYYGGIYRANSYLEGEKNVNWKGNEALRKQYQAEARFLRAYYHFYLARLFGEIPALDHCLLPTENPGRTPAEDLYKLIIDDLVFCAENGLSEPYTSMDSKNWCRATKWSAEGMIGRVFLFYTGYYNKTDIKGFTAANAKSYIDDLVTNGKFSLVPKFASLWQIPSRSLGVDYAGEINPEVVWSVSAIVTGGTSWGGNIIQRMIGMRLTNIEPYGQGWGGMPVRPDMWDFFDASDSRRNASILNLAAENVDYDIVGNQQAQATGFVSKKYMLGAVGKNVDPKYKDWQLDGDEDQMIIRYADVLLMAAEFELQVGNNAKAAEYVNIVRERAFGDATHNLGSVTIDDIFKERKMELAFEGIRYFDILRSCNGDFSKLASILTYIDLTDGGDYSQSSVMESLDVDGNNFAAKKGLFQLPQNELELMNNVVKQNPGYN